jgi:hypothetical protein
MIISQSKPMGVPPLRSIELWIAATGRAAAFD